MTALRADAGFMTGSDPDWYDVTLAGFNYVDDRCAEYFDTLFKLNRKKEALKSGLSAFDQTSSAIMSITGTAEVTMQVIAQAFGLASNMTDIVAGTYLFELPPATTQKFVDETLHAYRNGAESNRSLINSPTFAYGYIRGYLNLCLPATIEGKLVDHIGGARAVADGGGAGADLAVRVVSDVSAFDVRALREPKGIDEGLPGIPPVSFPKGYEEMVTVPEWVTIQTLLCLKPDGKNGPLTRQAVIDFYSGRGDDRKDINVTGILESDVRRLKDLSQLLGGTTCQERGVSSAVKVGDLSR